jgi:Na+-transporting methylmalonyl-CoA/oxaloacetate decarboxylase beta subunit
MAAIINFAQQTGFYMFGQEGNWKCLIMIAISFVLLYLAIVKGFEPLLLLPIAFGMLCTNLPGADMFHEILFAGGHVHWDLFGGAPDRDVGSRCSRCGACPVGSRQHR